MWYSVSMLRKAVAVNRSDETVLWEEMILLMEADSADDAAAQAEPIGRMREHKYVSAEGDTIHWTFQRILSVCEIGDTLTSGKELFSRYLRDCTVQSLLTPFPD